MNLIDAIEQELTQESVATRRMLERTPMENSSWRPHPKSMGLGRLASHIAEIPLFVPAILQTDELDWNPESYKPACYETRNALLTGFEEALAAAQKAMPGTSNSMLMQPWRFSANGQTLFELPRIAVLRAMVLNHIIHHRGQLSVYFRLNNVPLPSVYGPTADEPAT